MDPSPLPLFDTTLLRQRRDRSAKTFDTHSFLHDQATSRLLDRLADVRRTFPLAAFMGCRTGKSVERLIGTKGVEQVVRMDLAHRMVGWPSGMQSLPLVARADALPFRNHTLDLVFSVMDLHWVNDVPKALRDMREALKPDGLLLACFPGEDTLHELRTCLLEAELAATGGAAPRVSPFITLHDAARLLQKAGFALPVADRERMRIEYPSARTVLEDLRGMGATNALTQRTRRPLRRRVLDQALDLYTHRFPGEAPGSVTATVDLLFLTGWAPAPSQPQPLKRGSAAHSLADYLERLHLGWKRSIPL